MDFDAWMAVATLLVAVTLFVTRWIPLEATALGIPVVLAFSGVLAPEDCLAGFGNQAVIALAGIFVLGAGLQESGVATLIARGLQRIGGTSPARIIVVLMIASAVMSAFMSNTATVAVLLPAVAILGRRTGVSVSQLMMPLAFAAILGGTLTLIGTAPNLILAADLQGRTGAGLGMFEFAVVGVPVTAVGIVFMATVGWRMLRARTPGERLGRVLTEELARSYGFTQNLFRMIVLPESRPAGQTIAEARFGAEYHLDIVMLMRGRRALHPEPGFVLQAGDVVFAEGEPADAQRMVEEQGIEAGAAGDTEFDRILSRGVTLAEFTVAPRSRALGRNFKELEFRQRFGLNVISIWRGDEVITAGTGDIPLKLGDAFLVSGTPERIQQLAREDDYVVLGHGSIRGEDVRRAPLAVLLLLLAILPPLLGIMPLAISALAGALLMVFTRCLSIQGARGAIDLTILSLVIGTIPLGIALEESGVATRMASAVLTVEGAGTPAILAALFLLSAVLSTTSNNSAAAVILAPVAYEVAGPAGLEPARAFLAVAMGVSCTFVLPFAHQCNLLVMGPAGYSTRDFARVGSVMSVLMGLAAVLTLSLL